MLLKQISGELQTDPKRSWIPVQTVTNLRDEQGKYTQNIPKNLIYNKESDIQWPEGELKDQARTGQEQGKNRAGAMEVHNWRWTGIANPKKGSTINTRVIDPDRATSTAEMKPSVAMHDICVATI